MSDLIERLKEDLKWMTGYDYPDQKEVSSLLTKSDLIEAISALETVRGIEEIAKKNNIHLYAPDPIAPNWQVGLVEDGVDESGEMRNFYGPTLSAAIEAARKGM